MMERNNGGPAFPGPSYTRSGHPNGYSMGMSLRDWFAGQALANPRTFPSQHSDAADIADWAYGLADAMLAAREATP